MRKRPLGTQNNVARAQRCAKYCRERQRARREDNNPRIVRGVK
jgi:hypothetical protein